MLLLRKGKSATLGDPFFYELDLTRCSEYPSQPAWRNQTDRPFRIALSMNLAQRLESTAI